MKSKQILFLFSFSCLFLFCQVTNAQETDRFEGKKQALIEALDLTTEQVEQFKQVKTDFSTKRKALRDNEERDYTAMKALKAEQKAAMRAILTPEQLEKWDEIKPDRKDRHADRKAFYENNKEHFDAMKADAHTYKKDKIRPLLRTQRAKLDQKMSAEDIAYIDGLRKQMSAHKKAAKMDKAQDDKPTDIEEGRRPHHRRGHHGHRHHKGHRGHHGKHDFLAEADKTKLKALATKYNEDIHQLHEEIKPQMETWKADMKENFKSHWDEMDIPEEKREAWEAKKKDKENWKKENGKRMEHRTMHRHIKFLLLNPDEPKAKKDKPTRANRAIHQTKVYPNPSVTNQTLEFTIAKAGKVQIDIVDKKGNVIKTVANRQLEAGKNTVEIDVSDLRGYVFYYRIQDASGASSTKFLVKQ